MTTASPATAATAAPTAGERLADTFGELVRRESRALVHGELTAGRHPAPPGLPGPPAGG